ncbi:MAG TPA: peptide chain release factor-like protein [Acidimicrobiales bacterium]|nr:peptide chain release factor-like protein [Acidimicrobiales bacterium]
MSPEGDVDGDLVSGGGLHLPAAALTWRFSRSAGPGGQHVNTSDTRVELLANLVRLEGPVESVGRVHEHLGAELRIVASSERSQLQNRLEARRRLAARLDAAARPRTQRRATAPPRSAVEARLREKHATAQRKAGRGQPELPDE